MFYLARLDKLWVVFLKPDLIPKLHILKQNVLFIMVKIIVVTMVIVGKDNLHWPKHIRNHHY